MTAVYERAMFNTVYKELKRTAQEASRVYAAGKPMSIAIDDHSARIKAILTASYKVIYPAFGQRVSSSAKSFLHQIEKKKPAAAQQAVPSVDTFEEIMLDWADEWVGKKVALISGTTETQINEAVQRGIDNGESREVIAKRIELNTGGLIAEARSFVIATTEVHTVASTANYEMGKALGIDGLRRRWIAVEDARTRPDHSTADGQEVGMEEDYGVGGENMRYPGDPNASAENTINCRCTEEFVVE